MRRLLTRFLGTLTDARRLGRCTREDEKLDPADISRLACLGKSYLPPYSKASGQLVHRAGGYQPQDRLRCAFKCGFFERSKNRSLGYVAAGRAVAASSKPAATSDSTTSSEQK